MTDNPRFRAQSTGKGWKIIELVPAKDDTYTSIDRVILPIGVKSGVAELMATEMNSAYDRGKEDDKHVCRCKTDRPDYSSASMGFPTENLLFDYIYDSHDLGRTDEVCDVWKKLSGRQRHDFIVWAQIGGLDREKIVQLLSYAVANGRN